MHSLFPELRERLLSGGVAPRHVRRYRTELAEHLADLTAEEIRAGLNQKDAEAAALARLGTVDELAQAMLSQPKLRAWSVRAPWAVCALAPLAILAIARGLALLVLWTGWQIFLPGANTPFGAQHVSWIGNAWFQFGRLIYFGTPFALGWALCVLAARQRLRAGWPVAGMFLVAFLATVQSVDANRAAISGAGHIHIGFVFGPSPQAFAGNLAYAAILFASALLPYLVWRWREGRAAAA
ncbi:MAG TPA: permease prefix domain 1-containing protein [Terracidiphilus sp.]|nr:permease prefix domain 1-containing protein [Terracidiphilus sp.]